RLPSFVGGGLAAIVRIGAVAKFRQAFDEAGGVNAPVPPLHRHAAIRQVDAGARRLRDRCEPVLDRTHAAAAPYPFDGKLHASDAAVEMMDEIGKIARLGHGNVPLLQDDATARAEQALRRTGGLELNVPYAWRHLGSFAQIRPRLALAEPQGTVA